MHANEPLPACVRAYGKLKRGWRDTSLKARARPPLTADNETEGGGGELEREEKRGGVKGMPTGGLCSHLLLPSFTCQRLSQSPQTGKIEAFSLLCRYQEMIIACSVFHTDNQDYSEQDKLPHRGVRKILTRPSHMYLQYESLS